ncbi:fungal specific transcription factor [Purpureocillium lilacinum]|uniref:Fungal specific transcription factor n=1 Tax=Purpureocillium lilacinum TaxID=33203 RepID=A0A179FQR3_PURLI|nr:fungal specific transcription factor [Purpureocillium lilacinum]GJN69445.1 hypothetical protein PLICBS_003493 [Purpureocillium lilacinum]
MCDSLFDAFVPQAVTGPDRECVFERLARTLAINSRRPLADGQDDAQSWLASFSGANVRWEGVGVLFVQWAKGMMRQLEDEGARKGSGGSVADMTSDKIATYIECADSCLMLCGRSESANTLLLYFLLKYSHVASVCKGDASTSSARLLAEAISVATSLGLHITPRSDSQHTSLTREIGRRLFAHVYVLDKVAAVTTGRPPMLSRRYCSTPLPLDVSDSFILQIHGQVNMNDISVCANVNAHGWSRTGEILNATIMRARVLMARVRDEILEIALDADEGMNVERLRYLQDHQELLYQTFPFTLRYTPAVVSDTTLPLSLRFSKVLTWLEHLQNLFFIRRLLVKACCGDPTATDYNRQLAETSYDIMQATLTLWTRNSDRPHPLQANFDWIIVSYACPAAGVLCSELIRGGNAFSSSPRRSDVIQQLSLLKAFLAYLGPDAPNACLWTTIQEVVSRVLDHTLNGGAGQAHSAAWQDEPQQAAIAPGPFHEFEVPGEFHDVYAFELLHSFDWLRPE